MTRYLYLSLLVTLLLYSCNTTKNIRIEGNLYFQMVDFYNFNNVADSIFEKLENQVINMDFDTIPEKERESFELIRYAIDQEVFRLPYIRVQLTNNENIMLYMDRESYKRFDTIKCFNLKKEGKKIHLSGIVKDISFKDIIAYKLVTLKQFDKIEGETECRK